MLVANPRSHEDHFVLILIRLHKYGTNAQAKLEQKCSPMVGDHSMLGIFHVCRLI